MKLLLDAHHSPVVAERLVAVGFDVVAACGDAHFATLPDDDLLRVAAAAGRAVVTENARDFDRIVRAWTASGEHHAGVIFTLPRRYHRGSEAYPTNLVAALRTLLAGPPKPDVDWVHWL